MLSQDHNTTCDKNMKKSKGREAQITVQFSRTFLQQAP